MIVSVMKVNDNISSDIDSKIKELQGVPSGAFKEFKQHTPIRSGNARRKTRLDDDTIRADYSYAVRLDQGSSKQAPDGMTKPTFAWIKKATDKIFKGR